MAADSSTIHPALDGRAVRSALGLILVGGPLVVIDLRIGQAGGLDLLNDTIGLGLIVWAVSLLLRQPGPPIYASRMRAVVALAVVTLVWSVVMQLAPEAGLTAFGLVMSGLAVVGIILFCTAMRDFSGAHGFAGSRHAWRQAATIVAVILGGGWAVAVLVGLVRTLSGDPLATQTTFDAGGPVLLLFFIVLGLALIPLISILVAIVTLRRELRTSEVSDLIQPLGT